MNLSALSHFVMTQVFSKETAVSAPYSILGVVLLLIGFAIIVSFVAKKSEDGFKVGSSTTAGIFSNGIDSKEGGVAGVSTKGSIFTIYTKEADTIRKETT